MGARRSAVGRWCEAFLVARRCGLGGAQVVGGGGASVVVVVRVWRVGPGPEMGNDGRGCLCLCLQPRERESESERVCSVVV